jgi:cyclophilin family peptidyl-prolyl cis-trans isomerase
MRPMKRRLALAALVLFPVLHSCKPTEQAEKPAPATATEAPAPAVSKTPKVRLKTDQGEIVVELDAEKAPITVENFLGYVKKKHYDGTVFHRVMPTFMIQGGGFTLEGGKLIEKPTGSGIKNESQNGLSNVRGSIAMARTNDPNSATAQFFINVVDNPMLNYPNGGGYTVFGKVISGMEAVDIIKATPTGTSNISMRHPATGAAMEMPAENVPTKNVVILSASIVE